MSAKIIDGQFAKTPEKSLETAIDCGMTSIDTAPVYGFGQSEKLVEKAIKGKRDKVEILTKFGLRWDIIRGRKKHLERNRFRLAVLVIFAFVDYC